MILIKCYTSHLKKRTILGAAMIRSQHRASFCTSYTAIKFYYITITNRCNPLEYYLKPLSH